MSKIVFLIPYKGLVAYTTEILAPKYPDIEVVLVNPRTAVPLVQQYIAQGVEIVAARPVTATAIRQANLGINVVTIPITSFDIIRAINTAKLQGKKIAVVAHSAMVLGIDFLAKELGVEIQHYCTECGQDYEAPILEAVANGAEVILGGVLAVTAAKRHNIPSSLIKIGDESIFQAAQEAMQIQTALENESAKRGFFNTVLDHTNQGIITIDVDHHITAFNPIAQKLTKTNKTNALGQPLEKILPQFTLLQTSSQKEIATHSIINVSGNKVMYNSVPIIINKKSFGAVISLQEIDKIQQMEAMIRKEIYARGHVAKFHFENIIGQSPAILNTIEMAKDFAATNSSILILGETGTGKEVFAQSIHNESSRAQGPFVAINCASLPAQLLESELFGYVGGAFTGANKEGKPGLFEVAHGGTIFLDELAEMDYVNQGRLLRVLQEKSVTRLGSYKVTPVDVRIIAATNKDLEVLISERKFRDDLYYRLNVLRLELPPLRMRQQDIPLFAKVFVDEFATNTGKRFSLTNDALKLLEAYSWPGNIRECRNLMERIAATAKTDTLNRSLLAPMLTPKQTTLPSRTPKEKRLIDEITKALHEAHGNYTVAADILGINRTTLYRRMQRLRIDY
ncbi:sigma 54-interacting transcriptional regulator [Sporomusa acidovorans]|uniref:Anaerobic nitric oxide reductase transcription regulator NorR n=1 Tax=Sporomusa acidovorans (strain ATCC 49682 / DSM 3132 / Mol) TaxID=1123286 RepID=A0ABZ3J5N7_SPOA4|nr:sigma 54-interacting transcriptional regulator [Sporomusa acidovorans]OZC19689.1 limonene hydroxylase [Sporomusa acidovorans DSM 3132]SDF72333.1 Transcriptional regulator containing PAS, AAA-type ATPase, and DNA-binding Fis domains [Sporomusa acidovorans]